MGLNYQDSLKIQRIPPMTASETIDYYATGKVPERFQNADLARTERILKKYGVTEHGSLIDDMNFGGLF